MHAISAGRWWEVGSAALDLSGIYTVVFFTKVNRWLREEIGEFQARLLGDWFAFLGVLALGLLTVWILVKGYRIMTGRSRDSLMALVVDSLRATLVIGVATAFAGANAGVYERLTDGMGRVIVGVVANKDIGSGGDALDDLYESMDKSMAAMNLAMGSIEAIQTQAGTGAQREQTRNLWFAGFGTAGPAVVGGAMLLINKVAVALFVGLGPLFILCLLFDQTKSLFQRWLLYGVGTLFSLAVLYVMVRLVLDLTLAIAASWWISNALPESMGTQGINNLATMQGGLGIILTALLMTAPPMAAMFFQGTLGNFMHYSVFGGAGATQPSASGPAGAPGGYVGQNSQTGHMDGKGGRTAGSNYAATPTHQDRVPKG